ncbi:DMT family transporter [Gymnodinialimonas hymeniacidonis]|uniref:DMT family transporter n=1 Tax=Gymnodinialimonas hymeniacidonis TaxID=3126508 RepID=UPI0034C69B95
MIATKASRAQRDWVVAIASLLAAGALLGLSTNMAKLAGEADLTPLAFLTWSISGAAVVLFAVGAAKGHLPAINLRTLEYFTVAAFVTVAGSNMIFFSAVPLVGVSFVTLVITLPPLLTYVGALLLRMEAFDWRRAAGVVAALIGAGFLAIKQLNTPNAPVFWVMLTLLGPVLLAIGNIYRTIRWPDGERADALAPGMLLAAAAMLFAVALLPGFSAKVPLVAAWPIFLIMVQAIIFAAQFQLMFILQKAGGPVLLSLLGAVGAVVGVPVAILLLGEKPPDGLIIGSVLIGLGIVFVATSQKKTPDLKKATQ